jgi:hypothetical protein
MKRDENIDPVLKQWLDHVLVPVMVRQFLAILRTEGDNSLRPTASKDSHIETVEQVQ